MTHRREERALGAVGRFGGISRHPQLLRLRRQCPLGVHRGLLRVVGVLGQIQRRELLHTQIGRLLREDMVGGLESCRAFDELDVHRRQLLGASSHASVERLIEVPRPPCRAIALTSDAGQQQRRERHETEIRQQHVDSLRPRLMTEDAQPTLSTGHGDADHDQQRDRRARWPEAHGDPEKDREEEAPAAGDASRRRTSPRMKIPTEPMIRSPIAARYSIMPRPYGGVIQEPPSASTAGVTRMMPRLSPTNHPAHSVPNDVHGTSPITQNVITPNVAAMGAAAAALDTSFETSAAESKER